MGWQAGKTIIGAVLAGIVLSLPAIYILSKCAPRGVPISVPELDAMPEYRGTVHDLRYLCSRRLIVACRTRFELAEETQWFQVRRPPERIRPVYDALRDYQGEVIIRAWALDRADTQTIFSIKTSRGDLISPYATRHAEQAAINLVYLLCMSWLAAILGGVIWWVRGELSPPVAEEQPNA